MNLWKFNVQFSRKTRLNTRARGEFEAVRDWERLTTKDGEEADEGDEINPEGYKRRKEQKVSTDDWEGKSDNKGLCLFYSSQVGTDRVWVT